MPLLTLFSSSPVAAPSLSATGPRLLAVCEALKTAIEAALVASSAPGKGQVYIGWPVATEEVQKLGQPTPEGSITIYPIGSAKNMTRYPNEGATLFPSNVNLFVTFSQNMATFYGTSDVAYNIHGFLGGQSVDAYCATTASQSLSSIAASFAAAINAYAIPGVIAIPVNASVTITGAQFSAINIGGSGTYAIEEIRIRRVIQVSTWLNDYTARWAVVDAIISNIGTASSHFLTLSDGTAAYIAYQTDRYDDTSQSSYSLLAHHIWFEVEYGQMLTGTAYQAESFGVTQQIQTSAPVTTYFG